ncbi:hypothetical protein DKG34_22410 [Streptomyces sp. NWU49]|nr:hypothetical protein DKG34_22410 [Streptomyces sp. NWU49]
MTGPGSPGRRAGHRDRVTPKLLCLVAVPGRRAGTCSAFTARPADCGTYAPTAAACSRTSRGTPAATSAYGPRCRRSNA